MYFLQLKVVVWKNFIIRKRHWLLTIIESVLPILLFLLIAYGRSKISGLNKIEITGVTYNEPQTITYDLDVSETKIYYTPNTDFYNNIIRRVQLKYQMLAENVVGFPSSESLIQYYASHHNNTVIGIIFKGNDRTKLDYILRIHQDYYTRDINTADLYRNVFEFTPGTGTPYYYKGYLSIQTAVDLAFIEETSGIEDLDSKLTLMVKEFPYPPHKQDSALSTLYLIYLPVMTMFSFIFICPAVLKRVVAEKYSGTKELLKMVGMKSWMLWLGWFIYSIIPMLFSIFWIVLLMKVPFFGTEYPPIEHTDGTILFIFLMLYCMAATVFCFAISSLFNKPTIAMVAGILIWILSYFVPKYALGLEEMGTKLSFSLNMLLNLFPNMALHYGYLTVSLYEQRDLGIQWNNFYKSSSGDVDDITLANVFLMLIVDIVIYMSFTLYMDGVNPGKYGVRKSLLFPIYSIFQKLRRPGSIEDQQGSEPLHLEHVENGQGLEKGIEVENLVKRYGHKLAVNNLSISIYKDQITVLLGHNGAGKSTTMSMITGMLGVTSGTIKINGKDIRRHMGQIRQSLGLCPQHNLLFTDLTVGEHLIFFAKLKGKSSKEAESEMLELLDRLNMFEKKNEMADTLSGGMKRKLCLGMAIIGGSKVLILDEPTSGMDPESRRELWDLLLAWRGEKTILITTHFMEEADALGDWIAIMAEGSLQCHGTPMYLKKKYDTGYHLSLMVKDNATVEERESIKRAIKARIDSEFKDANGNNMVFLLPLEDNSKIVSLLSFLENNKEPYKIENISVTVTTLEDVFLKVKMDSEKQAHEDATLEQDSVSVTSEKLPLFGMRITALVMKKLQFYRKKLWTYVISAVIALAFFILTIYLSGNVTGNYGDNGPEMKYELSAYKHTTVYYNGTRENDLINKALNVYQTLVENNKGTAVERKDVEQGIVDEGIENIVYYKEHVIVSAELKGGREIEAVALYNSIATHSAPISLNLITNALVKAYSGSNYSIRTSNWPLETINAVTTQEFSGDKVKLLWSILMPVGVLLFVGSYILFAHIELSTNFAKLQYMCGVMPLVYWMVNFVVDYAIFLLLALTMGAVAVLMAPYVGQKEFGTLFLIFLMYGASNIPFVYLFSRKKSASSGFALFIITGIFFGIILTIAVEGLMELGDDYYKNLGRILKDVFILFLPQVGLTHSFMIFCEKAVKNYNMEVMPRMKRVSICIQNPNPCCEGKTPKCAEYQSYLPLLAENVLLMLCSSLLYMTLTILVDTYCFQRSVSTVKFYLSRIWYGYIRRQPESLGVYRSLPKEKDDKFNSLKAKNLHKTYSGKQVVKDVGFTLKEKECLGILGVNGAGKSTTFRMLTREEVVDRGNVEIINQSTKIPIDQNEYLQNLGYCPQIDALNFVLTGREILTVIAKLRGVNDPDIVDQFLTLFELEPYADMACGHYSGGNKRKLSLAVALIGYPKFVLLDEPTNGVDPSSRRNFWNLIRNFKEKRQQSFILTSHSMVECEALCNNLKIMKDGRFEKEGTISELKKEHGGFNIKLKLVNKARKDSKDQMVTSGSSSEEIFDETDTIKEKIDGPEIVGSHPHFDNIGELKEYFRKNKGIIKDEHSGLLHIYVDDKTKTCSSLFKEVEDIKRNNGHLIEDYSIGEASLEDVFLTVARSKDTKKKNRKVGSGRQTV